MVSKDAVTITASSDHQQSPAEWRDFVIKNGKKPKGRKGVDVEYNRGGDEENAARERDGQAGRI